MSSLDAIDPAAGFPPVIHNLLSTQTDVLAQAAALVLVRFFNPIADDFLQATGLHEILAGREMEALLPIPGSVNYSNRTTLWEAHGGQRVSGIGPLEDGLMCVFADEEGPHADRRIPDTNLIEYRGDGLVGHQRMTGGNQQLANYQAEKRAIRYWHKPLGGDWEFESWAVIVERRYVWGKDTKKNWRREYAWVLAPVPSPFRDTWPAEVLALLAEDTHQTRDDTLGTEAPVAANPSDARERYQRLCASVESRERQNSGRSTRTVTERYFRSAQARLAVLLRADGRCENPKCAGQPNDVTDKGDPILEVDHVNELARGGRDHPSTMIALCPNCHAIKTRGSTRRALQKELLGVARGLHLQLSTREVLGL
ncbi:HNH endonuclease [Microbispora sp. H10885]|uniref:HNH endonuclease n=1 Tax=Microbispora sp. H10885 TaxID=2729110 RepID=UPI001602D265|nr:HNH endonuclease [Microbispora sp. H10885]